MIVICSVVAFLVERHLLLEILQPSNSILFARATSRLTRLLIGYKVEIQVSLDHQKFGPHYRIHVHLRTTESMTESRSQRHTAVSKCVSVLHNFWYAVKRTTVACMDEV